MKLQISLSFVVEVEREDVLRSYSIDFRLANETIKQQIENIEKQNIIEYGIDHFIDMAEENSLSIQVTATEIPNEAH
jgi:hypothetical protein